VKYIFYFDAMCEPILTTELGIGLIGTGLIGTDTEAYPNLTDALEFERVIHAIALSARAQTRFPV